jgi:hypothetical protein
MIGILSMYVCSSHAKKMVRRADHQMRAIRNPDFDLWKLPLET